MISRGGFPPVILAPLSYAIFHKHGLTTPLAVASLIPLTQCLENVAGAGNDQRRSVVGDGQHGFEPAQNSVGAPVLGQFDRRALQLSLVLVELRLEALKQRECVRGGARKTRQHSVVEEPAYLARGRFNDDVAERHLAIAAERHAGTAPNRQYGSAVKDFHVRNEEEVRRRSRSEGVSSTAPGD